MKKLRNLLGGRGEVIKRLHWITGGRGGGLEDPKKDYVIFEWSLICMRREYACRHFCLVWACATTDLKSKLIDVVPYLYTPLEDYMWQLILFLNK